MGSIFDILGPVMVGPSSSHTAGAARIGMVARQLFGRQPEKAAVYLHGSFAATGKGHGTDRALIAGLLGMKPDDMRIPDSFEIAAEEGMTFTIAPKEIREAHPNTAQVIMEAEGVAPMKIQAYSVGGGRIRVCEIDGIDVNREGSKKSRWRLVMPRSTLPRCRYSATSAEDMPLWWWRRTRSCRRRRWTILRTRMGS